MKTHSMKVACHMTAGIKRLLLNTERSKEIRNALDRFQGGDFGRVSERPSNDLIKDFGSYELSFGTLWIISYEFFADRDFITLLLPGEYDGPKLQNSQPD